MVVIYSDQRCRLQAPCYVGQPAVLHLLHVTECLSLVNIVSCREDLISHIEQVHTIQFIFC